MIRYSLSCNGIYFHACSGGNTFGQWKVSTFMHFETYGQRYLLSCKGMLEMGPKGLYSHAQRMKASAAA